MGGIGSGRHCDEGTPDEAWLSGCIYVAQRVLREDARRYQQDKAELERLRQLAQGEAA